MQIITQGHEYSNFNKMSFQIKPLLGKDLLPEKD